jgi:hypothetical protein
MQKNMMPLNDTVESVTLRLELQTISNMYWTFMMAFQQSFEMQKGNGLMGVRSDLLCRSLRSCILDVGIIHHRFMHVDVWGPVLMWREADPSDSFRSNG